jgi:hypothetical protein
MLSMPCGTDAQLVMKAAREFAQTELRDHRYVMVLHEHQANPHVHLSVRAESSRGERLNPRKTDLHRWRETFAEKLRGWGVDAEATRQATRGANRNFEPLWRVKAKEQSRLRDPGRAAVKTGARVEATQHAAVQSWARIWQALQLSADPADQRLAADVAQFMRAAPAFVLWRKQPDLARQQVQKKHEAPREIEKMAGASPKRASLQPGPQPTINPDRDPRGPEMVR